MGEFARAPSVASCDVESSEGCSERETKYIGKWTKKGAAKVTSEIPRLEKMAGRKMTADLLSWVNNRIYLLGELQAVLGKEEL